MALGYHTTSDNMAELSLDFQQATISEVKAEDNKVDGTEATWSYIVQAPDENLYTIISPSSVDDALQAISRFQAQSTFNSENSEQINIVTLPPMVCRTLGMTTNAALRFRSRVAKALFGNPESSQLMAYALGISEKELIRTNMLGDDDNDDDDDVATLQKREDTIKRIARIAAGSLVVNKKAMNQKTKSRMKERRKKAIEIITLHYFMTHRAQVVNKMRVGPDSGRFTFIATDTRSKIEDIVQETVDAAERAETAAKSVSLALSEVSLM